MSEREREGVRVGEENRKTNHFNEINFPMGHRLANEVLLCRTRRNGIDVDGRHYVGLYMSASI